MQFLLVLSAPDVYKSQNSDTYIVFGEAKARPLLPRPSHSTHAVPRSRT